MIPLFPLVTSESSIIVAHNIADWRVYWDVFMKRVWHLRVYSSCCNAAMPADM